MFELQPSTMRAMDLSGRTLLAVFAHPDDESIACGGVLARCAGAGARVVVMCATHGENRGGCRDADLFEARAHELRRAADALGVSEVVLLEYPDGFLPWVDRAEFEARIANEIRRLNPDVVITFGDDGLYWHPDHIAVHERTTAAVASCGDSAPALYYVTMPPGQMRKLVNEWLAETERGSSGAPILGVIDVDAFGIEANPPTLVIDVSTAANRKLAAIKCHQTQVAHGALDRLRDDAAARLLGIEHFHRSTIASTRDAFIERL
jgi:LmbE family N-acetylglucosaminyl deacetylase